MVQEINYKDLGLKIKSIRMQRQYTQEKLAELVGCNTSHISNIENNYTKASLNVLLSIANALNTSIDNLLKDQYSDSDDILLNEIMDAARKLNKTEKEKILKIIDII